MQSEKKNDATNIVDYKGTRLTGRVSPQFFFFVFIFRLSLTHARTHAYTSVYLFMYTYYYRYTHSRENRVPQYVRCREHTEDLQPRKLYYSGRLGSGREKIKTVETRGFYALDFLFIYLFFIRLHFRYNTSIYRCIVCVYTYIEKCVRMYTYTYVCDMFFVIHRGRSKKKKEKKTRAVI